MIPAATILEGHLLEQLATLQEGTVHTCVTSPPYWGLRDYGTAPVAWPEVTYAPLPGMPPVTIPAMQASLGMEPTLEAFIGHIVLVFRDVGRTLHKSGTCWVNMGDAYTGSWGGQGTDYSGLSERNLKSRVHGATSFQKELAGSLTKTGGLKNKDLQGQPWRIAFALQADGWYLRSDIIWHKPNPMPESISDRPTKSHEYLFLLAKSKAYYYDAQAIVEQASSETHARISKSAAAALGVHPSASILSQPNGWENSDSYHGTNPRKIIKVPAGWDQGENGHGSVHRDGRRQRNLDPASDSKKPLMRVELAEMPLTRNKRTVWTVPTEAYKDAHFATFPTALVRPCVLAGTSAKGCCPHCSTPWVRGVPVKTGHTNRRKASPLDASGIQRTQSSSTNWAPTKQASTEWQPGCQCPEHTPIPCTVLDPHGGSGTTAEVALDEGRHAILCELSPEYVALIKQRLARAAANRTPQLPLH